MWKFIALSTMGFIFLLFIAVTVNAAVIPNRTVNDPNYVAKIQQGSLKLSAALGDSIDPEFQKQFMTDMLLPSYIKDFAKILNGRRRKGGEEYREILAALLWNVKSDDCKGHILEWIWRVGTALLYPGDIDITTSENQWVLHMVDSWGKPPEGILSGHVNAYGDFNECIEMKATIRYIMNQFYRDIPTTFEGRYCTVYVSTYNISMSGGNTPHNPAPITNPKFTYESGDESGIGIQSAVSFDEFLEQLTIREGLPITPSMGVCLPNTCTRNDIQQVLVNTLNITYTHIMNNTNNTYPGLSPIITKNYPNNLAWPLTIACYEEKKPDFDAADISVMALIGSLAALCLVTGAVDYWLNHGVDKPPKRGKAYKYFMAFSMYTNIKKWMSTRKGAEDFGCLHGIRVFSTAWVVLAHTYYVITFLPQWNMIDVKTVYEDWSVLTVINSTFAVDTFFVMSGMLVAYNILKVLEKTKGKLNIIMLYIHRYLRLTPTYAILIGIMATIIPYLGNGPYWVVMTRWGQICEDNWWTNLLYVNNFVNTSWLCQGEAWYLANDMQFYIVSPLIVYPMWRWEIFGLILLAIYTILSCASPMLLVHFLDTTPTTLPTRDIGKWFTHIYIRPYARIQTFLVGVWLAWILHKTKGRRVRLSPLVVAAFWLLSTGTCFTVLYSIQDWFNPKVEIPTVAGLAYAGLSRMGWGISIAWIMFACMKGYGGLINSFLSWSVFMPLGRLCYCVYLVSLHLQMILHIRFTQPIRFDSYTQINFFFAHLLMSFIVGFFATLLFESPFMILQKLIFEGQAPPKPAAQEIPLKRPSKRYGIFYSNTDAIMNGGINDHPTEVNRNSNRRKNFD